MAMIQVAVYGKGGIGKSTISANMSYALSQKGLKVMQIGCDPKHDSTRLLLGGKSQKTVLDYVREVPVGRRRLEDVVVRGSGGVLCTEAGGPEPGVGCAGRGILTTFDILRKLGADRLKTDVRVYDVLGDVVCGGFAVPLRSEYADGVVLVTSGEFMSLYAANNILKGIRNFDTGRPRVMGIVLNSRGVPGEEAAVRRFATAVGTDVISVVPRDRLFSEAESRGGTVCELYPDSEASNCLTEIAERVVNVLSGRVGMTQARPLDDAQMSDLATGSEIRPHSEHNVEVRNGVCSGRGRSIRETKVMNSCAAYGAAATFLRLRDYTVIIHGPMSCAYLMDTSRGRTSLDLYAKGLYLAGPSHGIVSSMMDDSAAIFGGTRRLRDTLERVYSEGARKIAVITTCMPGIIGDDCPGIVEAFETSHPEAEVHLIPADGDVTGDFNDGMEMAAESLIQSFDDMLFCEDSVNLVGTSFFRIHSRRSSGTPEEILGPFGLDINCRFIDESSSEEISRFLAGGTDILISGSTPDRSLMNILSMHTGRKPFPLPLPTGIVEYESWVEAMGDAFDKTEISLRMISEAEEEYGSVTNRLRRFFNGKRVAVVLMASRPTWLLDILSDLECEVMLMSGNRGSWKGDFSAVGEGYGPSDLSADLGAFSPELVVGDVPLADTGYRQAWFSTVGVGYRPTLEFAEHLGRVMRLPASEGWREGHPA